MAKQQVNAEEAVRRVFEEFPNVDEVWVDSQGGVYFTDRGGVCKRVLRSELVKQGQDE